MNRTAPAVITTALLLVATACGSNAGAAVHPAPAPTPVPASALAGIAVLPRGFTADPNRTPGAFTVESYLTNYSAEPALDRALLLNAGFVEGYHATQVSADRKQRYTLQLFKAATPAKAKTLQAGFWRQEPRTHPFQVPGALSNAQTTYDAATEKTEAVAEASIVVGSLLAVFSVHQSAPLGTAVRPNTALIADVAVRQRARLTSTSS